MYCVTCHEEVKGLDRDLAAAGGKAVFGNNDGYAMGPPEVVFPAVDKFASEVKEKHGLTLQVACILRADFSCVPIFLDL